eukprot:scaffold5983_cov137-Isochrysis_galbana.AAC.8
MSAPPWRSRYNATEACLLHRSTRTPNSKPDTFPRHTADAPPCGARARPAPPRESSGVGGVAVTRSEGTASIATTRHPHSHHTHTHTAYRISLTPH